ncbi:MAG: hypothetical protein OIF56_15580 [Cohaesibacter sp.]|nr:hypothetical protein [Cohaesibacter sp.]
MQDEKFLRPKSKAIIFATMITLLLPTTQIQAASKACPRSFQEGQSLSLSRKRPKFEATFTYQKTAISEQRVENYLGTEQTSTHLYHHGLLEAERQSNGQTLTFSYDDKKGIETLPTSKKWLSELLISQDSKPITKGILSLSYRGQEPLLVGKCRYQVWKILNMTEIKGRDPVYWMQFFSPDLGLVLRKYRVNRKGRILSGTVFDAIQYKE